MLKVALLAVVLLVGCRVSLDDPVKEDAQIRKFMVEYLGGAPKAEVWVRRVCGGPHSLCGRDHLSIASEVRYVEWLDEKQKSEVKRSEAKMYEGEEEDAK